MFAAAAIVLLVVFDLKGWLAWRNRRSRRAFGHRVGGVEPETAVKEPDEQELDQRAKVMSVGDLVMDARLRAAHKRRSGKVVRVDQAR